MKKMLFFSLSALFLIGCTPNSITKPASQERCAEYARIAVDQNEENHRRDCGFTDPRWHSDYDAHYHWCLEVPQGISESENRDRQILLDNYGNDRPDIFLDTKAFPDIPENKKFRLAVIEFKALNKTTQTSGLGTMISEMFTTEVVNSNAFKIVERGQLRKVLRELKIGQSGIIDITTAQEIGKMIGADAIITGSVMKIGGNLRIDARIIEVKTGMIISAESKLCKEDLNEISMRINEMAKGLAGKFYQKSDKKE